MPGHRDSAYLPPGSTTPRKLEPDGKTIRVEPFEEEVSLALLVLGLASNSISMCSDQRDQRERAEASGEEASGEEAGREPEAETSDELRLSDAPSPSASRCPPKDV